MSKLAAVLLLVAALGACSSSGSDDEAPGGQGAGTSGSGGGSGAAGTTHAGEGGASGTSNTSGAGGTTAGSNGVSGTGGSGGDEGGNGGTGASGVGGSGGNAGGEPDDAGVSPDTGIDPDGCVVARRIDDCCQPWLAVEQDQAKAEPCLVALGEPWPEGRVLELCMPDVDCRLVDCAPGAPSSLEAFRGDGACMFADECTTDADCVIAQESTSCCACHGSMPKRIVEQELCITAEGETPDFAVCGGDDCFTVLCAECEAPAEPTCAVGDDYNRCR